MSLNRSLSTRFSSKSQANGSMLPTTLADVSPATSDNATAKALAHIKELMKRPLEELNESNVSALLDVIKHTDSVDDRKMLLEHVLSFMAKHPNGKIPNMVRTFTIKTLYNDLAHPPATYIGPEYQFRAADGSSNNPDAPNLGKAGTPYARSVQGSNPLPRNQMPDAGLVFDTLLRREKFVEHPQGLSALMFSFAALVIHSVFRSDHTPGRQHINMTSGYVDLAPLYGNDQDMQDKVRNKDGRGLLHPDVFAEDRLLFLPPAVCVLLVLFNRNHNYIARRLLEINERGTWKDPTHHNHVSHAQLLKQDEEIFQTARLCNCAWFAAVVFSDYFSAILGLVRQGSNWSLEPFDELRNGDHSVFERGRGNACSVEFNCLYRWHATTSIEDEEWIALQFKGLFPDKNPEDITLKDFYMKEAALTKTEPDLERWTFGNLQRETEGPNKGSFRDSDLAGWLQGATSHRAASFGARGTPAIMRLHEIMGIEANRAWGVCSLNDFRKFLGLKTYTSFLEWNPNREVADAAEKLYGHINNLELYVGLQAEETKPLIEGAGLCPGYTISRAILSDAFALTRGDRFYTQDFTPYNLTAWGFADCQRDADAYGFGSTLGRLFLRTLPNDYSKDSIYTWFPLIHPDSMEGYLKDLGKLDAYNIARPKQSEPATTVDGYVEVGQVLQSTDKYVPEYVERAAEVLKGKGFFTASTNGVEEQKKFIRALAPSPEAISAIGTYFHNKTKELIEQHSFSLIGQNIRGVDIVRDVLKFVPLHWTATEIAGIPIKTKQNPHGVFTESQLFDMLGEIYQFIFLEVDIAYYMPIRQRVKEHVQELTHLIKSALGTAGSKLPFAGLIGTVSGLFGKKKNHNEIVKRLFEFGCSTEEVVNSILALLVGATVEMSLALTNVVNLLVHKEYDSEVTVAANLKVDAKDLSKVTAYITEALRIDPPFAGVYRVAKQDETIESLNIKQGQRLFLHIASANMNEDAFPNPRILNAARTPRERYLPNDGCFKVLGDELASTMMAEVLRAVLALENSGKLTRFSDGALPVLHYAYLNEKMLQSPWPTSMVINYDA
ncbi:putative linoleate diol synthase [Suillus spraguei]|nr:putative linoleate diol synthase [Suillus spraguei]